MSAAHSMPRIYFSTWLAEPAQKTVLDASRARYRLLSYALIIHPSARAARAIPMEEYVKTAPDIFLDSGAFTAWTKGQQIDLDAYADFILSYPKGTFTVVANLDVIPGEWGKVSTQAEIDKSASKGWENFHRLQARLKGHEVTLLHIYHQGEDVKWLKKLLAEGGDYIGISPGNDRTTRQKIAWLDAIMPLCCDAEGWPLRKMHAFGVTALDIITRYPWYSIDSTTWVLASRFGACFISLDGGTHKITFSDQSPSQADIGKHFNTYTPPEQRRIRQYVEGIGLTVERLAADYRARDQANVRFFLDLEKTWTPKPFRRKGTQPAFELL